jgi:hypothetical protein
MKREVKKVYTLLKKIKKIFPDGIYLFAWSDSILIVDSKTQEIYGTVDIPCDGGDPNSSEIDGKEYLDFK